MARLTKPSRARFSLATPILILLCLLWLIPTLGLLISSFRTPDDVRNSGWWTIFPHRAWQVVEVIKPEPSVDRSGVMSFAGASGTFDQLRTGIETSRITSAGWQVCVIRSPSAPSWARNTV